MEAGVCDFSQGLPCWGRWALPDHSEPAYEENSPNLSFQLTQINENKTFDDVIVHKYLSL